MKFRTWDLGWWLVLALSATASAQDAWLLTTADFKTERVSLRAIGDNGATVAALSASGELGPARLVDFDQFLQIDRIAPARAPAGNFLLHLASGERFAGAPRGVEQESLSWAGTSLGDMKVPLADVRAIVRAGQPAPSGQGPARTGDVVTLTNGDAVLGIIAAIETASVSVQQSDGQNVQVPLEAVQSIEFAAVAGGPGRAPADGAAFRVILADDSCVIASSLLQTDRALRLRDRHGASRSVPISSVLSIEQVNGPLRWLSATKPTQDLHLPFLDYTSPAKLNQSVSGRPIRFGDRTFARGIGVHSYSRLTWPIDPSMRAFRTQYAMDGDLPYADVTVRILLDDRVAHETTGFKAGVLSPVVVLDLDGARSISLEVDYGQTYDVQDRFNWIEPALLKSRPAQPGTAPSTAPAP